MLLVFMQQNEVDKPSTEKKHLGKVSVCSCVILGLVGSGWVFWCKILKSYQSISCIIGILSEKITSKVSDVTIFI